MALPGWDSVDTVSRLIRLFTIAGFASLLLLGIFQVLGYLYGIRKNELIQAEQQRFQTQQVLVAEARDREQEQQRQAAIAQALERQKEAEGKLAVLEEKHAPRNLSSVQKTALSSYLSKHPPGKVIIKSSMAAADARAYSEQLAAVMRQCGWMVQIDNAIFTGSGLDGVWISFRSNTATPAAAVTLYDAFRSAGIPIRAAYDSNILTEQEIWLSVGAK